MSSRSRRLLIVWLLSITTALSGCASLLESKQVRHTSSTVDYLYQGKEVAQVPSIPHLALPLRVGIAFVPVSQSRRYNGHLSAAERMKLMDRIASEFESLPFVKHIELIPTEYLTLGGGFTNLDQIRTMFGLDVIALISYDQVQHTDEGFLSMAYWTLIGAYVIKGEKNDTSTMVDAVLLDIPSRSMLFRAPGTSHIKGSATMINRSEQLRADSLEGFRQAADNLVGNLHLELERFQKKVKETPESYAIEHKPGYTGGGSLGAGFAMLILAIGSVGLWLDRKTQGI